MKESTPEGFEWGYMGIPFTNNPDDPIFIMSNFGTSNMVIWKEKPELVKAWAKEFLLFMNDFDIQVARAEAGIYPSRTDYVDDQVRVDALTDAAKAVAQYSADNNVILYGPRYKVTMTSPAWNQAKKNILDESTPAISEGRQDPISILEQAEELVTQAWEEQGR